MNKPPKPEGTHAPAQHGGRLPPHKVTLHRLQAGPAGSMVNTLTPKLLMKLIGMYNESLASEPGVPLWMPHATVSTNHGPPLSPGSLLLIVPPSMRTKVEAALLT